MGKAKGLFSKATFCPFCGVEGLERDRFGETSDKPRFKNEFLCTVCGKGIVIGPSTRYMQATALARGHRQMRPPDHPPKEKPADMELYTLQKYAERLNFPGTIVRTKKIANFAFYNNKGVCVGTASFSRAMLILRGYEIAVVTIAE